MGTHVQGSQREAHGMGEGVQDRAEEDAKEGSKFRQRPPEGSFGLIAPGKLWKASCASESGAKEMGIAYYCACQSFVRGNPQEEGSEVDINSKELWLSMPMSKAKAGPIRQGQPL